MKTKFKIFINTASGLSGIILQKPDEKGKYRIISWDSLPTDEKQFIAKLFSDAAIVYNANVGMDNPVKQCSRCKKVLPISEFYKRYNTTGVNVGTSVCKECAIKRTTDAINKRNAIDPEKRRAYFREYARAHYVPRKKEKKKVKEVKQVEQEKVCRDCIRHDYCFPEKYENESNFANTCKKYDKKPD